MTAITVVGGVYHERCLWPEWRRIFGSGGRGAAAITSHVGEVTLRGYADADAVADFRPEAELVGLKFDPVNCAGAISFEYVHGLADPVIRPPLNRIHRNPPIFVDAENVLRFGMLEGTAVVAADYCVFDPQSVFSPEIFSDNGSSAKHLAIVLNRYEAQRMTGASDPVQAAQALLRDGAEVVAIKQGPAGALVVDASGHSLIEAYRSSRIWKIGSGDVFAAMFAARWAVHRDTPIRAAELASKAVANFAETMALPSPKEATLLGDNRQGATTVPGRVYLAGPFFTIGQRWVVDEARRRLADFGLTVFSPVHDVGPGPAEIVAPADLVALNECDRVFAILDGLDSGTLFEVGYARARDIPVYGLSQNVSAEDLKMLSGSNCRIFDDFVTAIHFVSWRA